MSPALLTRMSMSEASFASLAMSAGFRRSTTCAVASIWCAERSRSVSAFNWSPLRAASRRWQPSSAKDSAAAAPMPFEAPVIRTRLPRKCRSIELLACWGKSDEEAPLPSAARPQSSTLHCSVASRRSLVHCNPVKKAPPAAPQDPEDRFDEPIKKTIPDRGHSRRRHRQGSDAGGAARHRDGGEKARRGRAIRSFRLRLVRLLRKAWRDDAGGLEAKDRQARCDLFWRGRLADKNSRSHFLVGLADQIPQRIRPVRQPAPGAADARRAVAAGGPQARRYRFLGGARKHRGRIFLRRRAHVPGHRPRIRHPADGDDPNRRRPHPEIRL